MQTLVGERWSFERRVGGSRTSFFTIIFGKFPKVELPTSRYFENSQSLGILISQRLGNIPIFGKFQFPTIHRNFHIFSIAYLSEVVSSHFFVRTSLFFSIALMMQLKSFNRQSRRWWVERTDRGWHRRIWQDWQELVVTICWFKTVSECSAHYTSFILHAHIGSRCVFDYT